MTLARLPDWRSRLSTQIEGALQQPFEWGVHDCALFAADAVLAMTGTDPAAGWRGLYGSRRSAMRLLDKGGYDDLADVAARHLPEVHPSIAATGDIAVVETDDGPALGVVCGALVAVPGPEALSFVPRSEAVRAFHVPFAGEAA